MHRKGHRQVRAPLGAVLIPAAAAACALLAAGIGTAIATTAASASVGLKPTSIQPGATSTPTVALHQGANAFISVTPAQAYVGGTVSVTFTLTIFGDVGPQFYWIDPILPTGMTAGALPANCLPTIGCPIGQGEIDSGTTNTLQLTLTPTAAGQYTISGQVNVSNGDGPSEPGPLVSADVAVLQPSITVLPPVGSPGSVVLVYGTDFPPGEPVQLTWKPGITAAATPPIVGPDGTFVTQLLILGGDQTGARAVLATGTGFSQVTTPFLVTKPRLMPPLLGAGQGAAPAATPVTTPATGTGG